MTCAEIRDEAAAFVLGALTPAEERVVRDHLATCNEAHEEFAELGGVVPALAASVEQVEPPPALRARIMAAAAADLAKRGAASAAEPATSGQTARSARSIAPAGLPAVVPFRPSTARRRASSYGWAIGIAAAFVIAGLGAWNVRLQAQLGDAQAYQQRVDQVLAVARTPGSVMAVLSSPTAGGQDGLVAIGPDGRTAMVVKGLPATSGNEVYEVWVIAGSGAPVPVGALSQAGGLAFMDGKAGPVPAGATVALTREPGPNPAVPTSSILVKGVVGPSA